MKMEILSEGAIELNDIEVFNNCSYSCYANIADALNKLKEYEDIGLTADEIKLFLCDFGITVTMRNRELIKELQEYRKKEMAKKPNKFDGHFCGTCNGKLARQTDLVKQKYCHHCGQKIKWN